MNFNDLTKKVRRVPNVKILSVCTLILLRHKEVSSYSEVLYKVYGVYIDVTNYELYNYFCKKLNEVYQTDITQLSLEDINSTLENIVTNYCNKELNVAIAHSYLSELQEFTVRETWSVKQRKVIDFLSNYFGNEFTQTINPKETPLARFNSRECFGELVEIENLGATFVINNEEPDSCNLDYDKYKLSLNKKFVSNFCSFIEIPEKHKSEAGNIDKAEIKEVLSTPGMAVISVTPRKTNVAQMIEDLEHSPLFAPIDTDLKNRKLKYIASSTIEPLNYGALTQAFGIYYDEYHTFNQEKNIVCLSGLRMPFSTVQAIGNSADSLAADLAKSVNEDDENPLAGKGSAVFSNLRAGKPNRRGPRKMVSVETDQETGEKRERKISNRRKNLLERYGGRK